jgi:hypothetical protein
MPACASISNSDFLPFRFRGALIAGLLLAFAPTAVFAVEPPPPVSAFPDAPMDAMGSGSSGGRTQQPEEDDFRQTPYTSFGEFSDEEEAEDTRFFQYGRFFGVSLGIGYEGATGNRGAVFTGGMPAVEARVHYWFDFNFALTLGVYSARHQFTGLQQNRTGLSTDKNNFNLFKFGAELRYYLDTRDATAPVTFAGPFVLVGVGSYSKSQNRLVDPSVVHKSNAVGFSFGGGLEFPLKPKKSYLNLETKLHAVSFDDTGLPLTTESGRVLSDTGGMFFTIMMSVLFTY